MEQPEYIFRYQDYPLIPLKFFVNDRETPYIDALLDSGGDFIVIPKAIAKYLGVTLEKAGSVDTAGGTTTLYKASVDMVMGDDTKKITYTNLEIHVSGRNDIPVLLGRHPIFEDHEIVFRKKHNQLILKPVDH